MITGIEVLVDDCPLLSFFGAGIEHHAAFQHLGFASVPVAGPKQYGIIAYEPDTTGQVLIIYHPGDWRSVMYPTNSSFFIIFAVFVTPVPVSQQRV